MVCATRENELDDATRPVSNGRSCSSSSAQITGCDQRRLAAKPIAAADASMKVVRLKNSGQGAMVIVLMW